MKQVTANISIKGTEENGEWDLIIKSTDFTKTVSIRIYDEELVDLSENFDLSISNSISEDHINYDLQAAYAAVGKPIKD